MYVTDTHALLWYMTGHKALSPRAKRAFDECVEGLHTLYIPAVVLIEALRLIDRRSTSMELQTFVRSIETSTHSQVVPLDWSLFKAMTALPPSLELHDRAIAATAMICEAPLITKDTALKGIVRTLW